MTDILDLQDWRVTATRQEDGELVIEAEYSVQPAACLKCGVIGRLYKHGPKPITVRDSPVRGGGTASRCSGRGCCSARRVATRL